MNYLLVTLLIGLNTAQAARLITADPIPGSVSCTTQSNGVDFSKQERDPSLARSIAVSVCTSDNRTNNAECTANLWCNDQGYTPPTLTCTTFSGGVQFTHRGLTDSLTRSLAVGSCTGDSRTNHQECSANAWCSNQGIAPPLFSCNAFSNGAIFAHDGRSLDVTREFALKACTDDHRTSKTECRSSVVCSVPAQVQPPIASLDQVSKLGSAN